MTRVRVGCFSISLDGFGAGPDQALDAPLGVGGEALHEWMFTAHNRLDAHDQEGGVAGVDDEFVARGSENMGAWILGRNMFGPIRGPWPEDNDWKGWWGPNPPFHVPVFVLTHHARPSFAMEGGTTFHFVTGGIHEALDRAREAAAGRDVRIGGGVDTVRQYLCAGLIDELHIAIIPVLLGRGEALFHGVDMRALGFECVRSASTARATHVVLRRG